MKAKLNRAILADIVATAVAATEKASQYQPILGCITIEANTHLGLVVVRATDGHVFLTSEIAEGVDCQAEGSVAVEARLLHGLLKTLPGSDVELENKGHKLVLKSEHSARVQLDATIDPASLPRFPEGPGDRPWLSYPSKPLKSLLSSVVAAASPDASRGTLHGVKVTMNANEQVGPDGIVAIALDGGHAIKGTLGDTSAGPAIAEGVLPRRAIELTCKLAGGTMADVEATIQGRYFFCRVGDTTLAASLLDGQWLPFNWPNDASQTRARVDRSELVSAIELVKPFARDLGIDITIAPGGGLAVHSETSTGQARRDISGEASGPECTTRVKHTFLSNAIPINVEHVSLGQSGELGPVMVTSVSDEGLMIEAMIAPMRRS